MKAIMTLEEAKDPWSYIRIEKFQVHPNARRLSGKILKRKQKSPYYKKKCQEVKAEWSLVIDYSETTLHGEL